jgi:hypothetical protein
MTTHALLLEYLSAYNKHDINKIVNFLHPDCRVIFNGQVVLQGIEAMQPTYEKDFLNPQANANLVDYHLDISDQNRIRTLLKMDDNRVIDVTYVFEMNDNKKMIEHIIHSVKFQQESQS